MSTAKISDLLDIKRRKLLAIAIKLTDRFFHQKSISIRLSQLRNYQVWRDRTHVAIVDGKTSKLIVWGKIGSKSDSRSTAIQNITNTSLWKEMQQHYSQISAATSVKEINSAWQFLRPLDPTIQRSSQTQSSSRKVVPLRGNNE